MSYNRYYKPYNAYHSCIVRNCKSSSVKTPGKLWIQVPTDINRRNTWLKLARKDPKSLSTNSRLYFCEDHFDLQNDMENYTQYKIMGSVKRIRMKRNCIPSKFEHQAERKDKKKSRCASIKQQKKAVKKIEETMKNESDKTLPSCQDFQTFEQKCGKQVHAKQIPRRNICQSPTCLDYKKSNPVKYLACTDGSDLESSRLTRDDEETDSCDEGDVPLTNDDDLNYGDYCELPKTQDGETITDSVICTGKSVQTAKVKTVHYRSKSVQAIFQNKNKPDTQCAGCQNKIEGCMLVCVQCTDRKWCSACAQFDITLHPRHYVIRVPAHRPQNEINQVLDTFRALIQNQTASTEDHRLNIQEASINIEVDKTMVCDEDIGEIEVKQEQDLDEGNEEEIVVVVKNETSEVDPLMSSTTDVQTVPQLHTEIKLEDTVIYQTHATGIVKEAHRKLVKATCGSSQIEQCSTKMFQLCHLLPDQTMSVLQPAEVAQVKSEPDAEINVRTKRPAEDRGSFHVFTHEAKKAESKKKKLS